MSQDPTKSLGQFPEHKIPVSADAKRSLLRQIARYGISEASLFPDLDGLARDLKQEVANDNLDH